MFRDWDEIIIKAGGKACVVKGVATFDCIPAVFLNVLTALLMFVGTFALFLFIMAGYKYMNSAGDPKKLEGARNNLTFGIMGLLIVLFSFFIIWLVSYTTGVSCIGQGNFGFDCN